MMPNGSYQGGYSRDHDTMNTSSISGNGGTQSRQFGGQQDRNTPRAAVSGGGSSNYRRAFKPQLTPGANTSHSGAFSTLNSEDKGMNQGNPQQKTFYENPIVNRQSLNSKLFGSERNTIQK